MCSHQRIALGGTVVLVNTLRHGVWLRSQASTAPPGQQRHAPPQLAAAVQWSPRTMVVFVSSPFVPQIVRAGVDNALHELHLVY